MRLWNLVKFSDDFFPFLVGQKLSVLKAPSFIS